MSRDATKLHYAETHEWVDVQSERDAGLTVIGISAFAIEQLNDLVYMDLPEVGRNTWTFLRSGENWPSATNSVKSNP